MGESSACLVRSFSAGTSTEAKENHWIGKKRSCFSNNRYLKEAEKSSKPGSVAEKKAYFDAHYKRIAAKKAAALLDQQVLASNELDLPESDNVDDSPDREPNVEGNESKTEEAEEAKIATKQLATDENSIQVELSNRNENVEIRSKVASSQQEKMATTPSSHQGNSSLTSKKKLSIRSSNSFTGIRASKLQSSVKLSPVQDSKEDSTTQTCKKAASNLASVNRFSVHHSQTHLPLPERRRIKPLDDCSGPGRRAAVGKSQSPSTSSFKPAVASGYKRRPPIVASSFSFRCEEGAAKRKEKLEEKLNAGGENIRLQAKSKIPLPQPRSPMLGRKPTPSMVKDTGSLLP
ncbi:hypothetical protein RHMOL_Rhmol12G0122300 [Rhododendron molle]|uniref:Uncharacterized protein n=1 Tax=Rhododendron molle TaxID=49168 RepID=A0ACC0LHG6_RHOML|nr:hypothetical protein RHMOL_Rhmol12G0122300 [Rhododendron molle]